jgi:DNA-binding transcriptional MerR regulator
MLGVTDRTIKNWLAVPEFARYFSAGALNVDSAHRELSQDDLFVLNTIRIMRSGASRKETNWSDIAKALENGVRERQLPAIAAAIDPGMALVGQVERIVTVGAERDAALARVAELEKERRELRDQLTEAQKLIADDRERLMREMKDISDRLARTEGELELWRAGRLKPQK